MGAVNVHSVLFYLLILRSSLTDVAANSCWQGTWILGDNEDAQCPSSPEDDDNNGPTNEYPCYEPVFSRETPISPSTGGFQACDRGSGMCIKWTVKNDGDPWMITYGCAAVTESKVVKQQLKGQAQEAPPGCYTDANNDDGNEVKLCLCDDRDMCNSVQSVKICVSSLLLCLLVTAVRSMWSWG